HQALAHADALYNFARWLAHDPVEAEDLVQEAYVRALAAAHQFEPGTSLKAWLFRILRNAFFDRRRRSRREADCVEELEAEGEPAESAMAELQLAQIRALVAEDVSPAACLGERARRGPDPVCRGRGDPLRRWPDGPLRRAALRAAPAGE
ncbi:MAG TPA: sigma-70 family RNA polymerase sigma factor, partial [Anaeromyxobacteraceae bacterium]|nr:sigma-70 family RNA polymerase sigma factor [Anaeromyxobacteraceae bacterium]